MTLGDDGSMRVCGKITGYLFFLLFTPRVMFT